MADLRIRRLKVEIQDLLREQDSLSGISVIDASDLSIWRIKMEGPKETLYEGEVYTLSFRFPQDYPMEAPEVIFEGEPPVNEHVYGNGHICLSILYDQWSPALNVISICLSIQSMLASATQKMPPVDNEYYLKNAHESPKKTIWEYHDSKC